MPRGLNEESPALESALLLWSSRLRKGGGQAIVFPGRPPLASSRHLPLGGLLPEYLREEPLLFNLLLSQGPFALRLGLQGAAAASVAADTDNLV